jgi:hypothetical protein
LVHPAAVAGSVVARLRLSGESSVRVWIPEAAPIDLQTGNTASVELSIVRTRIDRRWPLVGGTIRVMAWQLRSSDREAPLGTRRSLIDLMPSGADMLAAVPGVSVLVETFSVPADFLIDGARLTAVWTGVGIVFER